MIWFNEVKSITIDENNIEDIAKWMRAKVKYISENQEESSIKFIELKTARGYIMINLGDEIHMDNANHIRVVRHSGAIDISGTMPEPKTHKRNREFNKNRDYGKVDQEDI